MRATIKSIAKDLDISHMTVSRALSGNPNVNPETRKMVLAHAKQVGYVKSSAANAMRGDPTAIIGLLLPNIINEFYARFANALALLCADRGLDLVIHLTNDDPEREQQSLLRLQALQASTVILVPAPTNAPMAFAPTMRIIELIRTRTGSAADGKLLIDDGPAIAAAVAHLARVGRRRIAFIGADTSMSSGRGRLGAYEAALKAQGLAPDAAMIRTGAPSFVMGHDNMSTLLAIATPPDALICGGFEISNGALDCCLRNGVRFPQDIAFVGYGDPIGYRWIGQGISTIDISPDGLANQAIELLGPTEAATPPAANSFPTTFILRGSAGP